MYMRRITGVLTGLFLFHAVIVTGQAGAPINNFFKTEQDSFLRQLKSMSRDSVIINPVARYFESDVNGIYSIISSDAGLSLADKEKAVRSLVYFMKELRTNMVKEKAAVYDIPEALQAYKKVLPALIKKQPVAPILVPLSIRPTQALATAFSQYNEYKLMDDIAVFKRVSSTPQYILDFLATKPGFRFADSLITIAAAYSPAKLLAYLDNGSNVALRRRIRSTSNKYIQQIVLLQGDKNGPELLPFVMQLAEGTITPEEIIEKRTQVDQYFQLLINTLLESTTINNSTSVFLKPLRDGIKEKAIAFYANHINDLHESPDAIRFASVKGLRAEDLYYIITSCGDELYTSSYLGLYKRLMENFKDQRADSLFYRVDYDNFPNFMQLAANYNVLIDFFANMPREEVQKLLKRFMGGIEADASTGLERAMNVGDFFAGLSASTDITSLVQQELLGNYNRCKSGKQYLGIRLYDILLQVFDLAKNKNADNKIWRKLGNYEILKNAALRNKSGEINEVVLFYGDDDGKMSFNNFLKFYTDNTKWELTKNDNWVSIRSLTDQPLVIYANQPLDAKEELDLMAQDDLFSYLKLQSIEPTVLTHRGHSYHLDKTLKRLSPSVKLAILGSCGSYNKSISIASINPDVQVIGSRKTGTKSVNDPVIDIINETLLNKQDLVWSQVWQTLQERFSKDPRTLAQFNEYFPPSGNMSLFVLKLFMFYN
jgi:hypothetical protein